MPMNQSREGSREHTVGMGHWLMRMMTASPGDGWQQGKGMEKVSH
jgi:hypothetical protein